MRGSNFAHDRSTSDPLKINLTHPDCSRLVHDLFSPLTTRRNRCWAINQCSDWHSLSNSDCKMASIEFTMAVRVPWKPDGIFAAFIPPNNRLTCSINEHIVSGDDCHQIRARPRTSLSSRSVNQLFETYQWHCTRGKHSSKQAAEACKAFSFHCQYRSCNRIVCAQRRSSKGDGNDCVSDENAVKPEEDDQFWPTLYKEIPMHPVPNGLSDVFKTIELLKLIHYDRRRTCKHDDDFFPSRICSFD